MTMGPRSPGVPVAVVTTSRSMATLAVVTWKVVLGGLDAAAHCICLPPMAL